MRNRKKRNYERNKDSECKENMAIKMGLNGDKQKHNARTMEFYENKMQEKKRKI